MQYLQFDKIIIVIIIISTCIFVLRYIYIYIYIYIHRRCITCCCYSLLLLSLSNIIWKNEFHFAFEPTHYVRWMERIRRADLPISTAPPCRWVVHHLHHHSPHIILMSLINFRFIHIHPSSSSTVLSIVVINSSSCPSSSSIRLHLVQKKKRI